VIVNVLHITHTTLMGWFGRLLDQLAGDRIVNHPAEAIVFTEVAADSTYATLRDGYHAIHDAVPGLRELPDVTDYMPGSYFGEGEERDDRVLAELNRLEGRPAMEELEVGNSLQHVSIVNERGTIAQQMADQDYLAANGGVDAQSFLELDPGRGAFDMSTGKPLSGLAHQHASASSLLPDGDGASSQGNAFVNGLAGQLGTYAAQTIVGGLQRAMIAPAPGTRGRSQQEGLDNISKENPYRVEKNPGAAAPQLNANAEGYSLMNWLDTSQMDERYDNSVYWVSGGRTPRVSEEFMRPLKRARNELMAEKFILPRIPATDKFILSKHS